MAALQVAVLSAPALLAAGLASSTHCAVMCGALQATSTTRRWWSLQAGRLCAYIVLGAFAGASGTWLLALANTVSSGQNLRVLALVAMLLVLLMAIRRQTAPRCCPRSRRFAGTAFLRGLLTGLVPCTLLYAALALAALAGSAAQGALLMAAFGLGTVPAVRAGSWGWSRLRSPTTPPWARRLSAGTAVTALLLISALGTAGVIWCSSP